ncbi:mitochondrial large subunit ribosomal protein-domain-containing protein [Biscogniauxia marginata]|nr:mitochondrial large subunit ribosomal protein-domain-containing protein [Biscogniauxia marginata]
MLFRTLRPLTRASAPLSTIPTTRFLLPACARFLTTSITTTDEPIDEFEHAPEPANISYSEPVSPPTPSEPEPSPPRQLPYYVGRNSLDNFGVYLKKKRGGNLKLTLLKNGEGNLQALKRDVKDALQLPEGDVSVNSVTGHIVIRGFKRDEVLNFLHTMGF